MDLWNPLVVLAPSLVKVSAVMSSLDDLALVVNRLGLSLGGAVSYTHLTLPTIYSV